MNTYIKKREVKTIGIVAPASPQSKDFIVKKINILKDLGFKIIEGSHIYDINGYLAGKDEDRANDINYMFSNDSVDAILCFRGGYGSIRMAEFLDLDLISKNPKIFCGYSDITLLLNHLSSMCAFPTFHGPMVNSDFNDTITHSSLLKLLENNNSTFHYNLDSIKANNFNKPRNFSGKLVGGNLSVICSTIGTPYEINLDNNILLLEDINEAPYVIDRLLSQLIYSQKLINCSGIILGQFTNCGLNDYSKSFSVDEVLYERLTPLSIPIISNFPCGHDYPNLILPIGANLTYNADSNVLFTSNNIFK